MKFPKEQILPGHCYHRNEDMEYEVEISSQRMYKIPGRIEEINTWLRNNEIIFQFLVYDVLIHNYYIYYFRFEKDAVLFKLRWQ